MGLLFSNYGLKPLRDSLRDWNLCSRTHYLPGSGVGQRALTSQRTHCGVASSRQGWLLPCPASRCSRQTTVGAQTSPWWVHPGPHWRMTMAESGPPSSTPLLMQSYYCPGQKAAVLTGRGREMEVRWGPGHQGAGHWEPVRGGKK